MKKSISTSSLGQKNLLKKKKRRVSFLINWLAMENRNSAICRNMEIGIFQNFLTKKFLLLPNVPLLSIKVL